MRPTIAMVGNPADRRTAGFAEAATRVGFAVSVLSWRDRLAGAPVPDAGVVRIDSPGEDPEVDRRLRGDHAPVAAPAEVAPSAPWYRGFVQAMTSVERLGRRFVNHPTEIGVLFDKRATSARLCAAGVPVPRQSPSDPSDLDGVAAAAEALGSRRVFVKPRYGSCGVGVLALSFAPGRVHLGGNVSWDGRRLWSSLRPHRTCDRAEVTAVVGAVCRDEVVVEQWFPKAAVDGGSSDLRVVVIAGEPRHVVVRVSTGPVTNLNLGNRRGDVASLRRAMGPAFEAVLDTCRVVASSFPRCLYLGVDVLVSPSFRRHAVVEVNAFGDLLPGVTDRGQTTFEAEVAALAARVAL